MWQDPFWRRGEGGRECFYTYPFLCVRKSKTPESSYPPKCYRTPPISSQMSCYLWVWPPSQETLLKEGDLRRTLDWEGPGEWANRTEKTGRRGSWKVKRIFFSCNALSLSSFPSQSFALTLTQSPLERSYKVDRGGSHWWRDSSIDISDKPVSYGHESWFHSSLNIFPGFGALVQLFKLSSSEITARSPLHPPTPPPHPCDLEKSKSIF